MAFAALFSGREHAGHVRTDGVLAGLALEVSSEDVAGSARAVFVFSRVKVTGRRCFRDISCGAVVEEPGQRGVGFLGFVVDLVAVVLAGCVWAVEEGIQKEVAELDDASCWGGGFVLVAVAILTRSRVERGEVIYLFVTQGLTRFRSVFCCYAQ